MLFIFYRRDGDELLTVMLFESSESSSDEDDLDFLLVDTLFPEPRPKVPRLNLIDLSDHHSETMFRYLILIR